MANGIAYTKNYTAVLDEVYKRGVLDAPELAAPHGAS